MIPHLFQLTPQRKKKSRIHAVPFLGLPDPSLFSLFSTS
jgi:hypothetical protein